MKTMKKAVVTACLLMLFASPYSMAQRAVDFMEVQGNSEKLYLRVISESDAISAGNGVVKIQLPGGTTGAADLVPTSDSDASEVRIQTGSGTMSWREEGFWAKSYGGSSTERFYSICKVSDGGLAVTGYTESWGFGSSDFIFMKTQEDGVQEWAYAMGFVEIGGGYEVIPTSSGGFFLTGYYKDASYRTHGYNYLTNSTGGVIWSGAYGNTSYNQRNWDCIQTADGHYVTIGSTETASYIEDFFINKINGSTGITIWSKEIGTSRYDYGQAIAQRSDGGYVATGNNRATNNLYDMYFMFLDASGNEEASYFIGGDDNEYGRDIAQLNDGNYVLVGTTASVNPGNYEYYITKRDGSGNEIWSSAIGGSSSDQAYAFEETNDGGFVIIGETQSYGTNIDMWLVKTDSLGNPQWSWAFGGTSFDYGYDLALDDNGCIYACGYTRSWGAYSTTSYDGLIVKFSPDGTTCYGSQIVPGSDNIAPADYTATRIDYFNVNRTSLPWRQEKAHCYDLKQDLQQTGPTDGEVSITPGVVTICN